MSLSENKNQETIILLKEKVKEINNWNLMVRIPDFQSTGCADFDYISIKNLIEKLEKNDIFISPEDILAIVEA